MVWLVLLIDGTRIDLSPLGKYMTHFLNDSGQIRMSDKDETYGTDWANFLSEIKDDHMVRTRVEYFIAQQQPMWLMSNRLAPSIEFGSMLEQLARDEPAVLVEEGLQPQSSSSEDGSDAVESAHEHDHHDAQVSTMASNSNIGLFARDPQSVQPNLEQDMEQHNPSTLGSSV